MPETALREKVASDGTERLEELQQRLPDIPHSIVLKADVLREGVRYTPELTRIGKWALPQIHFIFEWDHDDVHRKEDVTEGWITVPQTFCLADGTNVLIKLDSESPYEIRYEGDGKYFLYRNGKAIEPVLFTPRPQWFTRRTRDGALMCKVAGGNGECVFSVLNLSFCQYFTTGEQCRFCTIVPTQDKNRALGMGKRSARDLERVVETFDTAAAEGNIQHFCLSGGGMLDRGQEAEYFVQLVTALRRADGYQGQPFLIASQAFDEADARRLWEAGEGTIQISHPIEVWDEKLFPVVCPGKARHVGRDRWLENMCRAAEIFGRGNATTNLVAGVETAAPEGFAHEAQAMESTVDGFAWLCRHDIRPSFSPWTIAPGSAWENKTTPGTYYYLSLGLELYHLQKKYNLTYDVGLNAGCYKCGVYTIPRDFPRLLDGQE
ncbi:MAG: radical SAM protein [Candidatus Binatia bacterium]